MTDLSRQELSKRIAQQMNHLPIERCIRCGRGLAAGSRHYIEYESRYDGPYCENCKESVLFLENLRGDKPYGK
jgi:DNA-directed RNA polymerase subunit RPC12/RpoP